MSEKNKTGIDIKEWLGAVVSFRYEGGEKIYKGILTKLSAKSDVCHVEVIIEAQNDWTKDETKIIPVKIKNLVVLGGCL